MLVVIAGQSVSPVKISEIRQPSRCKQPRWRTPNSLAHCILLTRGAAFFLFSDGAPMSPKPNAVGVKNSAITV